MQTNLTPWESGRKIRFRFLFLLLGSSSLNGWDLLIYFANNAFGKAYNPVMAYRFLVKPFAWLDHHLFHVGYDPAHHESWPGDTHFGVVFYLTLLLLSVIGTVIWTALDRKRGGYDRLRYWFRLYMRYMLAMTMFSYGIDKLIPVQMSYPSVVTLTTPMGEFSRFDVLWTFMGVAPGYMMLTGFCEILAAVLLVFRRTIVAGCLLNLAILVNVVAFNYFYNVPVKIFSGQLMIYTLYLLYPYLGALWRLFVAGQAVSFHENSYRLETRWKKATFISVIVVIPLLICGLSTITNWHRYSKNQENARMQKMYEVESFVSQTDTLPPLLTDTIRWKRCLFAFRDGIVICNMKDEKDYYRYNVDSVKKTYTLHDNPDTTTWKVFNYSFPGKDRLLLNGKWKGREVSVMMRSIPADSMRLNKEKIRLIQD